MELRHLRYFVAVDEELNVRRAAQRLHLSQPPLSRQLHDLEDEIETKLFDRRNRRIALTPAGKSFLKEAKQILSQVQRTVQLARAAGRGEAGQISVAILPPIGGLFLPPAIRAFRERFPAVELSISELTPPEQIAALMEQRIDVGFVPLPVVEMNPALEFETVREVELMAVLPPGHPLLKQPRLTLRIANRSLCSSLRRRHFFMTGLRIYAAKLDSNRRSRPWPTDQRAFSNSFPPALAFRFCRVCSRGFRPKRSFAPCPRRRQSCTLPSPGVVTINRRCSMHSWRFCEPNWAWLAVE